MEHWAIYKTKFGFVRIVEQDNKVVDICFEREAKENKKNSSKFTDNVFAELEEYFLGKRKQFDFEYKLTGTPFQIKVWNALAKIPYGAICTYKDLAVAVGCPKACRAVGQAVHNNPIGIALPCHRVIGSNGELTGYASGLDFKIKLLKLESSFK